MENIVKENINFKFFCEKCDFGTDFQSLYNRHLAGNKHLTGKRKTRNDKDKSRVEEPVSYTCAFCNITYDHITNYKAHNLNHHSTIETREKEFPFYCKSCDIGYFAKSKFDLHCNTKIHLNKSKLIN